MLAGSRGPWRVRLGCDQHLGHVCASAVEIPPRMPASTRRAQVASNGNPKRQVEARLQTKERPLVAHAHLPITNSVQQVAQPLPGQLVWVGRRPPRLLLLSFGLHRGCDCRWRWRPCCCAGLARWLLLGAHGNGPGSSPVSPRNKLGWAEGRCQGAGSDLHSAAHSKQRSRAT